MLTLILFIVIFSLLVLVHEAGHFFVAKRFGMKVEEFGMGLPPRARTLWTDRSGTKYTLNWIPFGGFVRLLGESGGGTGIDGEEKAGQPSASAQRLFTDFPLWKRISVVVAGVVMNLILAVVLLTVVFSIGFTPLAIVDDHTLPFNSYLVQSDSFAKENGTLRINQDPGGIGVEKIEPGSMAEKVGLVVGDKILKIGNETTLNGVEVTQALFNARGKRTTVTYKHEGQEKSVEVDLLPDQPFGIYITPDIAIVPLRFAPHVAVVKATEEVAKQTVLTVVLLKDVVGRIFSSGQVPEGVSGPVGIFQMTGQVSQQGVIPTLIFVALLSVSLAVMNIMPFPALDGGRFLFLLVELVTRRRPNHRVEGIIHAAGFGILLLIIALITWNDIGRLFAA